MISGQRAEREVQPDSMWTGLVNPGLSLRNSQTAVARARRGFVVGKPGIWLPDASVAKEELDNLRDAWQQDKLLAPEAVSSSHITELLGSVALQDEGCWRVEDATPEDVRTLAGLESGRPVLEDAAWIDRARQCQTPNCTNRRHYDLTSGVPSNRRELLAPNLDIFRSVSGGIETVLGDTLPTVEESRLALAALRRRCVPYEEPAKSLLTLGGIGQIMLLPDTGCWMVASYYMTPLGVDGYENWQYDGYGRLRIPAGLARSKFGRKRAFAEVAHRVIWQLCSLETLEGIGSLERLPDPREKILNHLCGFRPCCYPRHMELVSPRSNVQHGVLMRRALAEGQCYNQGTLPLAG